jgi:hypothetical protein
MCDIYFLLLDRSGKAVNKFKLFFTHAFSHLSIHAFTHSSIFAPISKKLQ